MNNPFAALDEAVRKEQQGQEALKAIARARCSLILGADAKSAFFATLAMKLKPEIDWSIETMATDGQCLAINPEFTLSLKPEEVVGVVAHEVMHNALNHHTRMGDRDSRKWNIATDLAINGLLVKSGFRLPKERLMPGEGFFKNLPLGLSAEDYYTRLPKEKEKSSGGGQSGGQQGQEAPDPGRCGAVREPKQGSPAELRESEANWEVAVAQATQTAKQRGQLPAGLARVVEEILSPKVDWRDVLRQFINQFARNDYSWSRPNRRFLHQGLYLPGLRSEELGHVVLAVDTSGSIGEKELSRFAAEAQGVLESYDCQLSIVYHDSKVQHVQTWTSSDGPLRLEPKGGGGTSHVCVFDWVAQQETPTVVVCLTDLMTEFPSKIPDAPVLWAVVGNDSNGFTPPFGVKVDVKYGKIFFGGVDMTARLAAMVKAVNAANGYCNSIQPIYAAIFEPLVGQKILKADGSLLAKIAKNIPSTPEEVTCYRQTSEHSLSFIIKTCQSVVGASHCLYHEVGLYIGEIRSGVLTKMYAYQHLRSDYTVEEVLALQKRAKEAKEFYNECRRACGVFGE